MESIQTTPRFALLTLQGVVLGFAYSDCSKTVIFKIAVFMDLASFLLLVASAILLAYECMNQERALSEGIDLYKIREKSDAFFGVAVVSLVLSAIFLILNLLV